MEIPNTNGKYRARHEHLNKPIKRDISFHLLLRQQGEVSRT